MRFPAAKTLLSLVVLMGCGLWLAGCGALADQQCKVTALVGPQTASADHAAAPPGNQVQFSATLHTEGSCVLPQYLTEGTWTTSDPANTKVVTGSRPNAGVATCVNATPTPATIGYTGTQSGYSFTSATLTCK